MKKIKISVLAMAALALGACTSDDVVVTDSASSVALGGDGYVSFAINLPTQNSTRAANDVYDDGLASEYAVNDATLLLFGGASEATATYYASYSLTTDWQLYETTTDNITSRSLLTQRIDTPTNANIYALVVLNNNGLLTDEGTNPTLVEGTTTLTSLQNTVASLGGVDAMTGTGLFMCNAPLIDAAGTNADPTGGTVTTLAYIDPNSIYSTEAEAAAHPATEIYVERGMAKVTVLDATTTGVVGDTDIPVSVDGFVLDLTNNVSYLVRNTTTADTWWGYNNLQANNYRMAGNVAVADGLYRTYWATDPNYSTYPYVEGSPEGDRNYNGVMTSLQGTNPALTAVGAETPLYCLENTFNVRHMNQDETTRVIIGATLYNGADFYVIDGNKNATYLEIEDVKTYLLKQLQAEGYMEEAEEAWIGPYDPDTDSYPYNMYDYITIVFDNESSLVASDDLTFTYEVSSAVEADWFVNPEDRTEPLGYVPAALVSTSAEYADVVEDLNDHHEIAYYEGGISYYPVMIKHFGDDLCPWDDLGITAETQNEESYPASGSSADGSIIYGSDQEDAWLGRYGVLRNNWYEINVTGVNSIGSPTVPTAYGDPDDPVEKWISIEINILSWAKRTQDVSL